jgi:hypothetical protein
LDSKEFSENFESQFFTNEVDIFGIGEFGLYLDDLKVNLNYPSLIEKSFSSRSFIGLGNKFKLEWISIYT